MTYSYKPSLTSSTSVVKAGAVGLLTAAFLSIVTYWESGGKTILTPYYDAVGVLTVCDGITNMGYPGFVVVGKKYTEQECTDAKVFILHKNFMPVVAKHLKHDVTNEQFLMLTDFVYGVGPEKYRTSTLLKHANAGRCEAAGEEFRRWVYAGGKKLGGLVRRANWHADEWLKYCEAPVWQRSANPKK